MFGKNYIAITSWITIFIALLPHMGLFQKRKIDKTLFESILRNFSSIAMKGLGSFSNDKNFAYPEELDDMTPTSSDTFDFIIVGAGSAGAAIAARLSETKEAKVLLVEAGDKENILMDVPSLAPFLGMSQDINWAYEMEPSPNYCRARPNQKCSLPRGKVMGGSSTINYLMATRGCHQIYDQWEKLGCKGWAYKNVLPLFTKLENLQANDSAIKWNYHGRKGPVSVTETPARYNTPIGNAFLEAAKQLGFPIVDYDGPNQIGFSKVHITVKGGMRCSSNRAYLHPIKGRKNLYLTKNSLVEKVLIDEKSKKAIGVAFRKNGKLIEVLAKKEVILSAGAINSPQILMLSGIGPSSHLKQKGIPVVQDAPFVGENLQDHFAYIALNFAVNASVTISSMNIFSPSNPAVKQYVEKQEGLLAIPVSTEAAGFIDVDNLQDRNGIPTIQLIQTGSSASQLNGNVQKPYFNSSFGNLASKPAYSILVVLLTPKSRGKILLHSNKPQDKPIIIPNYVAHPDDSRRLISGIRQAIKLSKTAALQKYKSELSLNPVFGCEKWKADSSGYWDCAIRAFGCSVYHPVGTCKMGAVDDPTAVVNPRLQVIGIQGLRVADASVMPTITTGHTNIPSMMIGEKLAEIVKEDWKVSFKN